MKLAFVSAALFLLSYVAVNGGLGPHPMMLIVPLLVAVGGSLGARWLMGRNGARPSRARPTSIEKEFLAEAPPQRHVPQRHAPQNHAPQNHGPGAPAPPPRPGGKARKLF